MDNIKAARSPSNVLANIRAEFGDEIDLNSSAAVDLWNQKKKIRRIRSARKDSDTCVVDMRRRRSRRKRHIPTTPTSNNVPNNSKTKCPSKNTSRRRHLNKQGQKPTYVAAETSDEEISAASSVDSDDLDYGYQYTARVPDSDNDIFDFKYRRHRQHKLDLVSKDIFSDSSSESESDSDSDSSDLSVPTSILICRE